MASNLDYLNPNLLPLEEKVTAYLAAEEQLRQLEVAARSRQAELSQPAPAADAGGFEQRPATGSFDQATDELAQKRQNLHGTLDGLREEILGLLPTRDEWVKVNLGYGPSRVGAFRDETAPAGQTKYLLRVVH